MSRLPPLKFIQINCHKSEAAITELMKQNFSISLIQEPQIYRSTVGYVDRSQYNIFVAKENRARAAIIAKKDINVWALDDYTDHDMVSVITKFRDKNWVLASVYLDINLSVEKDLLLALVDYCNTNEIPLLVGMDCNAHSPIWGSADNNARGTQLEDLIASNNLNVINRGNTPTFVTSRAKSVIDVTMINDKALSAAHQVENWRVEEEIPSMSDHKYVMYELGEYNPEKPKYRNLSKANWEYFTKMLEEDGKDENGEEEPKSLDEEAETLMNNIKKALDEACPLRPALNRKPNKWWNLNLEKQRKKVNKLAEKRFFRDELKEEHKRERLMYTSMIKKAKRESWKDFCSEIKSAKDISGLVKILDDRKRKNNISCMRDKHGKSLDPKESLKELLTTHFPNHKEPDEIGPGTNLEGGEELHNLITYIDVNKVKAAINSFGPKKAAGPDGLKPIVLQKLDEVTLGKMTRLYQRVIESGYTPRCWREMKVIFLPKQGKSSYAVAKAYRPITLSNFALKALERIIQWYVIEKCVKLPLTAQYAYTKGRSTELALSEFVNDYRKSTT